MRYRDIANKVLQEYWIKDVGGEQKWIRNFEGLVLTERIKKDFGLTAIQCANVMQKIKTITDPIPNLMFYGITIRQKGKKKRAYVFVDSLFINALGIIDVITRMKYPAQRGRRAYLPGKMTKELIKHLPPKERKNYIKFLPQAVQILDNFSNDLKVAISHQLPPGTDLDTIELKEVIKIEKCLK